jgi:hypothetical protein
MELAQVKVRAVPGQPHDGQLTILDLEDGDVAAVHAPGSAGPLTSRADHNVGGRAVELHLGRVGLPVGQMDLERPLDGEAATVLGAGGERLDALRPRPGGQAV